MFLHYDDARPHTGTGNSAAIQDVGLEVVPHPPYSLIWHRLTSGCLQHSTKPLTGIRVTCDEEVQAVTGKWFREEPQEFYTDGFEKLVHRWRRCIEREEKFVEKCGIDAKVHILSYILSFVSFRYFAWM